MTAQRIQVCLVYDAPDQMRKLQPECVARLAESMAQIGLQTPITVRAAQRIRNGQDTDVWEILTGRHRLQAAHKLGWDEIDAVIFNGDERGARMWEISENLHRAELTALERSEHVAEWVRLSDRVSGQDAQKSVAGRPEGGISKATRELGIERTEARRSIKVDSLSPEAKQAARDAGLADNRTALLKAAQQPAERQADAIRSYEPSRVKPAPAVLNEYETFEQWRSAGIRWWNRGGAEWRSQMSDVFDPPVFDKSRAA